MLDLDATDLTDWYEPQVTPERPGAYRCLYPNAEGVLVEMFSTWTGIYWSVVRPTPYESHGDRRPNGQLRLANYQEICWRGLTERGFARVTAFDEAKRLEDVKIKNVALLLVVRKLEEQGRDAKELADGEYQTFLEYCREDRRLAQRAKDRLHTDDLASLRPSIKSDAFKEYVEIDGTPDEVNQRLRAARAAANDRVYYWTYLWCSEMELEEIVDPSCADDKPEVEERPGPTVWTNLALGCRPLWGRRPVP